MARFEICLRTVETCYPILGYAYTVGRTPFKSPISKTGGRTKLDIIPHGSVNPPRKPGREFVN